MPATRLTLAALAVVGLAGCSNPSLKPYAKWMVSPDPPADQMTVRFMGTSTVSFDDGTTRIMIDGFFSRPPIQDALSLQPNEPRIAYALHHAGLADLAAIFVAHSHHDHAMDSARVAKKTGAVVVGSNSTANIARGEDFPEDRIRVVRGDSEAFRFGDFTVTVMKTPHTPDAFFEGTIDKPLRLPARVSQYREGGSYSFLIAHEACRILVVPSTSYAPGIFEGVKAHVVFLGIATLAKQKFVADYWQRAVLNTGARLVIPVHWDDFTEPLHEPLKPMFRPADDFDANMTALIALAERDRIALRLPTAFTPIALPPDAAGRTICGKAKPVVRTP